MDLVMSDVPYLCKVRDGFPIERSDFSHVGIELDSSLGAPGFDLCQEVVLMSRVNWLAVRSDAAQTPWYVCHC